MAHLQAIGSKIVWASSGVTSEIMSIDGWGIARAVIDTTTLETTNYRTNTVSPLKSVNDFSGTFKFTGEALSRTIASSDRTITMWFGATSTAAGGVSAAGTGRLVSFDITGGDEELLTASCVVGFTGPITWTT